MRKAIFFLSLVVCTLMTANVKSQTLKVGVFDIDIMVQAMPGYRAVDSLMQLFDRDSMGALRDYNQAEYKRLDSTYKADSALVAAGKKSKAILDMVAADRQKAIINVIYFEQIAQSKSNEKRAGLAQNLYTLVVNAYKKVLAR